MAEPLPFVDRQPVATHLPLAWTESPQADRDKLMLTLDKMLATVSEAAA